MKKEYMIAVIFTTVVLVNIFLQGLNLMSFGNIVLVSILFAWLAVIMKKTRSTTFECTEEFENVYQKTKDVLGEEHEKNKRSLTIFTIILFSALIILFCLCILYLHLIEMHINVSNWRIFILYGMISAFLLIASICLYRILKIQLNNKKVYEDILIPVIIKNIDKNLEYRKTSPSKKDYVEQRYIASEFDWKRYDIFECEDFLNGQLDGTIPFEMVELDIKKKVKNKDGKSEYETMFNGLFVVSQISKNICENIKISSDKFKLFESFDKTVLDSREFEKIFNVYSSDKLMAMRILSSDTMEALTTFYSKYKIDFEILIKKNMLYLRFFTGNLFEYKNLKSMLNKKELFLYYITVKFVTELTKKINDVVSITEI